MDLTPILDEYSHLLSSISDTYQAGKVKAFQQVNSTLVQTYWAIEQHIVEFEQGGNHKAEYGEKLLQKLSKDLSLRFGKGFSLSNVKRFRQFYCVYPIGATLSHQLSWSHYIELLKISHDLERSFYEKQAIQENWSMRELVRQKATSLFLRLSLSKDKKGILTLSKKGQIIAKPEDILRDTYIFRVSENTRTLSY